MRWWDGSGSSHLFFIIQATCNSWACFGWDSQASIEAIVTWDISCKWVSKYASDLEFSIYFYQNRGTTSNLFFPYPWIGQLHLDQGCISQISILRQSRSLNSSRLSSTDNNSNNFKRIQLILYISFNCQQINWDCLFDQLIVRKSL